MGGGPGGGTGGGAFGTALRKLGGAGGGWTVAGGGWAHGHTTWKVYGPQVLHSGLCCITWEVGAGVGCWW